MNPVRTFPSENSQKFKPKQEEIIMKNLVFIALFAVLTVSVSAKGIIAPDYIVTKTGTYFYEKVKEGFNNALVIKNSEGEKTVIDKNSVLAYKSGGRVFERMPEIKNGKPGNESTLMELIAYKHGIKVYREPAPSFNGRYGYSVHLFKNKDYLMTMSEENRDYVMDFLNSNFKK